ncbi:MAG: hypothetical protein GEU93_01940 [Propionibacteriales bacterium]|nr:hypothetical protein [Propionibacteriales bacterium]
MAPYRCIGFLTDYGLEDAFVAACHGVMIDIAPRARIVDITHLVPPQDVRRGSAVLTRAAPYLAPAVFVAVVDPGVGGDRRPVAIEAGDSVLVGPDNGLLIDAAEALGPITAAVSLDNTAWFRQPVSATFHGRDVFCPVAAHLYAGRPFSSAGTPIDPATLVRLPAPHLVVSTDSVETETTYVDRFGNVQLSAGADRLDALGFTDGTALTIAGPGATVTAVAGGRFDSVDVGGVVVYADSDRRIAIAVNQGRADELLGVRPGAVLRITRAP